MKAPEPDEERPLAWTAILSDTPVETADGTTVGRVAEVIGSQQDDIFHGIVITHAGRARHVLIPAENVTRITNLLITTNLSPEGVHDLPEYQDVESFHLGFRGLFGRLGWVGDQRNAP